MSPKRKGPKLYGGKRFSELSEREQYELRQRWNRRGWRTRRKTGGTERAIGKGTRRRELAELPPELLTDAEVEAAEREAIQGEGAAEGEADAFLPDEPVTLADFTHTVWGWRDAYPTGAAAAHGKDDEAPGVSLHDKIVDAWEAVPESLRPFVEVVISTDQTGSAPLVFKPVTDAPRAIASVRGQLYQAGIRDTPKSHDKTRAGWAHVRIRVAPPRTEDTPEHRAELERRRAEYARRNPDQVAPTERARYDKTGTLIAGRLSSSEANVRRRERYAERKRRGVDVNATRREREARQREAARLLAPDITATRMAKLRERRAELRGNDEGDE